MFQDQYPAHQIQAHVPQHGPRAEYKSVPFEGTTTNREAYKAYAVEPHRAMHAPVVARPYTKFEGLHAAHCCPTSDTSSHCKCCYRWWIGINCSCIYIKASSHVRPASAHTTKLFLPAFKKHLAHCIRCCCYRLTFPYGLSCKLRCVTQVA